MLAAVHPTSGPQAGVLEIADVERPAPGPGEVLVRVAVSGVNPTDVKARRRLDGTAPWPDVTPDQDGAGTIEAVGPGVPASRVGQRVWLYHAQWQRRRGTAAQWIALPATQAVALPDGVGLDLGACLGIPYVTAFHALHADGPIAGSRVLVHGGAGSVGYAAIELAKAAGAQVAATVSSDAKAAVARAAGADLVVDYRREDVAARVLDWAPDGVERIVDVDLVHNLAVDAEVIASHGTIVGYVETPGAELPAGALMARNARVRMMLVYTTTPAEQAAATAGITAALGAGAIRPMELHRFPLERIADAHDAVEAGLTGRAIVELP
ncbi:MAG: NADPH:quinone reductase [Solirubrobacteraceae bacterium]|nr:NADPH:quinone reductase [Solirubrobacteraceae bacterium]